MGALAQEVAREGILVEERYLKIVKEEMVIMKYINRARSVREGSNWIIRIIHPRWAIDEYAKIFRSWVWFRPPQPPTRVEASPRIIKIVGSWG